MVWVCCSCHCLELIEERGPFQHANLAPDGSQLFHESEVCGDVQEVQLSLELHRLEVGSPHELVLLDGGAAILADDDRNADVHIVHAILAIQVRCTR